ncbi:regulator of chromosome condensation 1/beta-lactamase-inhibitor protein II [Pavlovales sp. CCMP2436]|nr:regulator of chromosome condensation 1/beta-lactamase-inhibitor protein II [Pavlovales sp. CCMP2436]
MVGRGDVAGRHGGWTTACLLLCSAHSAGSWPTRRTPPRLSAPVPVATTDPPSFDRRQCVELSSGEKHTCASACASGAVLGCWGGNERGQSVLPALPEVLLRAAAGGEFSCGVTPTGNVYCWGANQRGQLGLGSSQVHVTNDAMHPVELGTENAAAVEPCNKHAPGWWQLPACVAEREREQRPNSDGPRFLAVRVFAGREHCCALSQSGVLKCWGENSAGQLGYGDRESRGLGAGSMGDALRPIELGAGRSAASASLGGQHTCVILASGDKGEVLCWGSSAQGALGGGERGAHGASASSMGDALRPLQLSSAGGARLRAVQLAAGSAHTCALLAAGTPARAKQVRCWGSNEHGALGYGDTLSRGTAPGQMGEHLPPVELGPGAEPVFISAGAAHSCALLELRAAGDEARAAEGVPLEIRCWGSNAGKKLGSGSSADVGKEVGSLSGSMGEALTGVPIALPARSGATLSSGADFNCATVMAHGGAGDAAAGSAAEARTYALTPQPTPTSTPTPKPQPQPMPQPAGRHRRWVKPLPAPASAAAQAVTTAVRPPLAKPPPPLPPPPPPLPLPPPPPASHSQAMLLSSGQAMLAQLIGRADSEPSAAAPDAWSEGPDSSLPHPTLDARHPAQPRPAALAPNPRPLARPGSSSWAAPSAAQRQPAPSAPSHPAASPRAAAKQDGGSTPSPHALPGADTPRVPSGPISLPGGSGGGGGGGGLSLAARALASQECYEDNRGRDYRGAVNTTARGMACQRWSAMKPHPSHFLPTQFAHRGVGDHNQCRAPGDYSYCAWCYTMEAGTEWDCCGNASYQQLLFVIIIVIRIL